MRRFHFRKPYLTLSQPNSPLLYTLRAAFFALLCIFQTAFLTSCDQTQKAERDIVRILHFNDVYQLLPKDGYGGAANMITLVKEEKAGASHTLLTFGGDLFPHFSGDYLLKFRTMFKIMEALGVDVAVLGNHEFDFGAPYLRELMETASYPILSGNIKEAKTGIPFGKKTLLKSVGRFKIGFFSLVLPETTTISEPGDTVVFEDILKSAQEQVNDLKSQGADLIIGLTHLSLAQDLQVADKVKGITLILGGHDHVPVTYGTKGGTLIFKCGSNFKYLGVVDIEMFRNQDSTLRPILTWKMLPVYQIPPDHHTEAHLDRLIHAPCSEWKVELLGVVPFDLDGRQENIRISQTSMGKMFAEALRVQLHTDMALLNSGDIRGDLLLKKGTPFYRSELLEILPFPNRAVVVKLTGSQILQLLEHGLLNPHTNKDGRYPQLAGIDIPKSPKPSQPPVLTDIRIGGRKLDLNKFYTLAITEYLKKGGDGYTILKEAPLVPVVGSPRPIKEIIVTYIKKTWPTK